MSNVKAILQKVDKVPAVMQTAECVQSLESGNLQSIKLPTIQLPKFNGNLKQWLEFKDSFESLIHQNEGLNDIQKFHYLRSSLSGTASQVIHSLEFSASNYNVAWDALVQRFNSTRILVNNHVKSIFDLNAIHKESAEQIRDLIDNIDKHLRSLEILKQPVSQWDTLIIFILSNKLDHRTLRDWETKKSNKEMPTYVEFKEFLTKKVEMLETLEGKISTLNKPRVKQVGMVSTNLKCYFCSEEHVIYYCPKFLALDVPEREKRVQNLKLCSNCLRTSHTLKDCTLHGKCRRCNKKHNSLLHPTNKENKEQEVAVTASHPHNKLDSILSTAIVKLQDSNGKYYNARALLDCGSQSNYLTSAFCKRLNLYTHDTSITVCGIGAKNSKCYKETSGKLKSRLNDYSANIKCLIIDNICNNVPIVPINVKSSQFPNIWELADPNFSKPGPIDLLIGVGLFWNLLEDKPHRSDSKLPLVQNTRLGKIIVASFTQPRSNQHTTICNFTITSEINDQLKQFWEVEEDYAKLPQKVILEDPCEEHFKSTYSRNKDGQFVVKIPFNHLINELSSTHNQAEKQLLSLERKFVKLPHFKTKYVQFMTEYEDLNHMSKVSSNDDHTRYHLPHHGVLREQSETTKLRTVFNGSAISDTGISLNQAQFVGPTIQRDLFSIITRFREHEFVITGDIKQMYRQVLVHPDDRKFQSILWRKNPTDIIKSYELNTVTYGTGSGAYLAIRSLKQAALHAIDIYPEAAKIIMEDFYVDDLCTGGNNKLNLIKVCKQVKEILNSAHFPLHKISSNDHTIISELTSSPSNGEFTFGINANKTLGILYSTQSDQFLYNVQ